MTTFKVGDRVYTCYDTNEAGKPVLGTIIAQTTDYFEVLFDDGEKGEYVANELEAA